MKFVTPAMVDVGLDSNSSVDGFGDNGIHLLDGRPIQASDKSNCVARMYSPFPYKNFCSVPIN